MRWVLRLGPFAFPILGLLDNSVVPLPGSMDALTIILAAHNRELWWYYALMATAGSVLGGFLTYHFSAKGGEAALHKKLNKERATKVKEMFERWGFSSIMFGAMAPPPVPIVPFLATAGVCGYPRKKFIAALALGRAIRFGIVALLASLYGRLLFAWISKSYKPVLFTLLTLIAVGAIIGGLYYFRWRKRKREQQDEPIGAKPEPSRAA